ncbi:lysM domain-containing GPI-anchored protein 1-like [Nymphaea colorata]|nr:lysM domain-containing GPI-anchored protein 1-like [Nymphaea colorata]
MAVLLQLFLFFLICVSRASGKSTIEPCSGSDSCNAMVGYTLPTDLKVSEVATLFQVDPVALLTANAYDLSYPDVENHILPARLFLKVPVPCSCVDGIRKVASVTYRARASDTFASIASSVYAGLVTADQIRDANGITDPGLVDLGQPLKIPLPCACFNGTDNGLPAVYLSYVVQGPDSLPAIAARYSTTLSDLMTVNAMGTSAITPGDILAIPLAACASGFSRFATDAGLVVANGSYAITASHCVQCSCGPANMNLFCTPAPLASSCTSMQCRNSNLMLGNFSAQPSSAGCSVSSCSYSGFVNGTIMTTLSISLQPRCPGAHTFPPLLSPPTVLPVSAIASSPSPSPSQAGGPTLTPRSSTTGVAGSIPGTLPAAGPSGSTSDSSSLTYPLCHILTISLLHLLLRLIG